jgi:hypothetical protein
MRTATVILHKLIQDTQDNAPDNPDEKHMLSQVFFTLVEPDGKRHSDMSAVLRQPFGTDYATEPIEVDPPTGSYNGNWNHNAFRDTVENYYRSVLASAFHLGPNTGIRMRNNVFSLSKTYQIEIPFVD